MPTPLARTHHPAILALGAQTALPGTASPVLASPHSAAVPALRLPFPPATALALPPRTQDSAAVGGACLTWAKCVAQQSWSGGEQQVWGAKGSLPAPTSRACGGKAPARVQLFPAASSAPSSLPFRYLTRLPAGDARCKAIPPRAALPGCQCPGTPLPTTFPSKDAVPGKHNPHIQMCQCSQTMAWGTQ